MLASSPVAPESRRWSLASTAESVSSISRENRKSRRKSIIDERRRRISHISEHGRTPLKRLTNNASGQEPENEVFEVPLSQKLSKEEMFTRYEEWMKIASENKINANNSWNLALIDYFHDMTILKDGRDNSVNFQKASCTLDGCVKIYSSRIDSVDVEAKKLLSGLNDSARTNKNAAARDDENGEEDDDENDEVVVKKKKARAVHTVESVEANLNVKQYDLEFVVDPLFSKTSADFDEGGARGLLLNHLSTHSSGKIIFDATDMLGDETASDNVMPELVDVSGIKSLFGQDLAKIMDRDICPSLKSFVFSETAGNSFELNLEKLLEDTRSAGNNDADSQDHNMDTNDTAPDMMMDDFYDNFDDHAPMNDEEEFMGYDLAHEDVAVELDDGEDDVPDALDPFASPSDPMEQDEDNSNPNAVTGVVADDGIRGPMINVAADEQESIFGYFDAAMARSWAGPGHYKLRIQRKLPTTQTDASATEKAPRKRREPFIIDFINGETISDEELFKPLKRGKPNMEIDRTKTYLLPEDTRLTTRDLYRCFLKPDLMLMRREGRTLKPLSSLTNEPQAPVVAEDNDVVLAMEGDEQPVIEEPVFDNFDVYDDEDYDNSQTAFGLTAETFGDSQPIMETESQLPTMDYGSQLVAEPKRVKTVQLNYAKRAKRVDVRRLKENIWKDISISMNEKVKTETQFGDDTTIEQPPSRPGSPAPQAERKFTEIVNGLKKFYPREKQDQLNDISVQFCFICLLHLANEQNLSIQNDGGLNELVVRPGGSSNVSVEQLDEEM